MKSETDSTFRVVFDEIALLQAIAWVSEGKYSKGQILLAKEKALEEMYEEANQLNSER